jgi:8-oxo-dGTP diphosphatase
LSAEIQIIPAGSMCLWRGGLVLLVLRREGVWAFPGGKLEEGETLAQCAERELYEETGITAEAVAVLGSFDIAVPQKALAYQLTCHLGRWISGDGEARSDARALRWCNLQDACQFPLAPHVKDVLRQSSILINS